MVGSVCQAVKGAALSLQKLMMPRPLRPTAGEAVAGEEDLAAPKAIVTEEPAAFIGDLLEALPPEQITVNGELRLSAVGHTPIELRKGGICQAASVRSAMVALEVMELIETLSLSPQSTRTELARHVQEGIPLSRRAEGILERLGLGEFDRTVEWSAPNASMALSMPRIQSVFRLAEGVAATVRSGVVVNNEGRTDLVNPERQKLDDAHEAIREEMEKRLEGVKQRLPMDRVLECEELPLLSATGAEQITLRTGERVSADRVRDTMLRLELLLGANRVLSGGFYDHVKNRVPLSEGDGRLLESLGFGTSFERAIPDSAGNRWGFEVGPSVRAVVLSGIIPVEGDLWLINPEGREHSRGQAASNRG